MLNQSQNQNQPSFQTYQTDQSRNPYPKSQRKDSNSNNKMNSKFSSNKPYQSFQDQRNYSNRERSRSRDISPRHSYHNYPQGNPGQNNNYNNRNNKPYHYRQSNERQFDLNMNKRERDNYSFGYNNTGYIPSRDDCLIIFQKNYFNFDSKDFGILKSELKRELKDDIYNIYYNYAISGIPDKIFRFTTNPSVNYPCKSKAIKIIGDYIFDVMKTQNDKVSYLKLILVIPDNVIGFIIGINGKNINQIREETNTKIEVYTPNDTKSYRKIEIAGVPQSIADAGEKIYEITKKYFNFNDEKILNRNEHFSPQREQSWGRDRNREQGYGLDNFRDRNRERNDRYYEGHWNKDYDNNGNNNRDYRGTYNRERSDFREMGYKNDYKNRDGYRNYGSRDMKNNNFNKDNNYRDYRDNGPRYKNNYDDRNNNKYNYDKRDNNNYNNDNIDSKNRENFSNKSFSRKSPSHYSNEDRSFNNDNNNEGERQEEKGYKKEDTKKEELNHEQQSENNRNLEPGEAKDSDIENNNYINDNNDDNNIKERQNEINSNNNENNIGVSNIGNHNNLENNINIVDKEEKEKNEIEEIYGVLARDEEKNDKLCTIVICLSSEEINLLNNSKSENDNIFINLEKSFHCSISKITKIIDDREISLITFNGTPKQNTLAIYQLQKNLLDTKNGKTEQNKSDN